MIFVAFDIAGMLRSRPMRVRGLKCEIGSEMKLVSAVAPHAGAWIEIPRFIDMYNQACRRAPCGCVD